MVMLMPTRFVITLALLTTSYGTARETNSYTAKQSESELLSLHMAERRAHFEHDVQTLLAHVAPVLLDVRDGRVNRVSREEVRQRFVEYFKNAQFSAWDDVEPPVVHVSSDSKMGWMIVRVRIAYIETDASGRKTNNDSVAAWMSAYEKQDGQWIMTAVTSTFGGA
jgi:hypothetical protein